MALHYPGTNVPMPSNLTQAAICGAGQKMGVNPCINGLSPTALKIAGALPQAQSARPRRTARINNLNNVVQNYTHGNQGDVKVDWAPTDKDHFFARYSQQHIVTADREQRSLPVQRQRQQHLPAATGGVWITPGPFSPTLVNDFRVGMNYFPAEANTQALTTTAGANLIPGQPTPYLPGLSFASSKLGGS